MLEITTRLKVVDDSYELTNGAVKRNGTRASAPLPF
jgi:hypothetical protein